MEILKKLVMAIFFASTLTLVSCNLTNNAPIEINNSALINITVSK